MLWNLRSWILHANVIKFVLFLFLIFLVFICVLDHADKNLEIARDAEEWGERCSLHPVQAANVVWELGTQGRSE